MANTTDDPQPIGETLDQSMKVRSMLRPPTEAELAEYNEQQRQAQERHNAEVARRVEENRRKQEEREAQVRAEIEREREERELKKRDENWKAFTAGRGQRYKGCRLDNFEATTDKQRNVVGALREYVADLAAEIEKGTNLILLGPVGTGKDHLMVGVCRKCIEAFYDVRWVNGVDLWSMFRGFIGGDKSSYRGSSSEWIDRVYSAYEPSLGDNERDVLRKLSECDVLAISDPVPPGGTLTDYQAGLLFGIIDARYSALRPTFVTVNAANKADLEARMGASTTSRLMHGAWLFACDWPSYRKLGTPGRQEEEV